MTPDYLLSLVTPLEIQMMLRGFVPMVMIIIAGVFIGRWDCCAHQLTLQKLAHYIFLPCLAFSAIHKHTFNPVEIVCIACGVLTVIGVLTLISSVVLRKKIPEGSNILASVFMSSGTLLLPLAYALFGNEGLAKAIYFHFFVILTYHTAGVWLAEGAPNFKALARTPFIYFIILGIAAQIFPFTLPESIEEFVWLSEKGIDLTAMGAFPLLLISFGYPLGLIRLSDARAGVAGGLLRVVAGPMIALLVVYICRKTGLTSMERGYDALGYLDQRTTEALLILGAAMPASNYAMRLAGDETGAGKAESGTLLVSTLAAIITIPVVLLLILMVIFTG